ncbi:hypothetical protein ACFOPN_20975 [Xanthomonas hyacinthi]|uniref:hypothetical protein n=1 Tax=Xanthomonas hyacinthi TaxID=56455 RepID=UPI0036081BAB
MEQQMLIQHIERNLIPQAELLSRQVLSNHGLIYHVPDAADLLTQMRGRLAGANTYGADDFQRRLNQLQRRINRSSTQHPGITQPAAQTRPQAQLARAGVQGSSGGAAGVDLDVLTEASSMVTGLDTDCSVEVNNAVMVQINKALKNLANGERVHPKVAEVASKANDARTLVNTLIALAKENPSAMPFQ